MAVELSPVAELDLDPAVLDFAAEHYCANCTHFTTTGAGDGDEPVGTPYCEYWDDETSIESGMICPAYLPKGFE